MPKKVYKTSVKFHCPYCDAKYPRMELIDHVEKEHSALIPEGYTATRVVYEAINKTDHGKCMICKKNVYTWNEKISRYNNLCDNPKCREEVRRIALERHMRVYNKPSLLDDPAHQEKMLSNRHISGQYKHSDGGVLTYTGKYEKATVEFMDKVMNIPSKDIQMPGPVLEYELNGEIHHWITDIYYIPANLIIEVKDGGDNPNRREMPLYRSKQYAKEVMITNLGKFNYLRLTNNNFAQLMEALAEIKYENLDQKDKNHVSYFINESGVIVEEATDTDRKVTTRDKRRLFHISEDPNIGILEPRIPRNFLVDKGYEDSETQRVCFATTIDGCLRAMSANIKGKTFYVYNPEEDQEVYIPTKEEVPDCKATGEVWVLNSVALNRIGEIKVGEAKGRRGIQYTYGKNTAELYNWNWEWVKKYNSIDESTGLEFLHEEKSELDDNFKPKKKINLSSLKKIEITKAVIDKYKTEYPGLKHVRCEDTKTYKCDGYMWLDKQGNLVCHVGSCEYFDDGTKWIVSLEVLPEYKGHGLSEQIIDFAVKSMGCKYLSVNKNNKVAKHVYDKYGFKTYQDDDNMNYMTIDKHPVTESYVFNKKDIYWNKDKFDSGEINLCFITGHSGSGKSTMGRDMQNAGIEHYEMDDLQLVKDHFTMEQLKEYGDLIYSFFSGPGKKFYVDAEWIKENNPPESEYEDKLYPEFVHHAMKYAKAHKNKKFAIEGVWLYNTKWFNPSEFKDYAFYIKGTSMIISHIRAAKRDSSDTKGIARVKSFLSNVTKNWKWYIRDEKMISKFVNYFSDLEDKQKFNEEVNALPSMGRYSTFIIPYTVKNSFDIAIGNDKNNEVLIRGDDNTFQTVGLEKFEELYQPSQIMVYHESDACEKFNKIKSCKSIHEALHILTGHRINSYDELMLCENLKLRDFESEDLGMEMIRRGVVRENQILSGQIRVYDTSTAIKPHVILSKTADGGCFIHTPKNYYLSSDIYATPEDIPQNVIDTMEDLYVSNAGTEELE